MTSVQMRVSISPLLWCEPDEYTTRCACAIMAPLELMRLEMLSCLRMPLHASVATLHQQASPVDTQLERRTGARTLGFMLSVWSTATHAEGVMPYRHWAWPAEQFRPINTSRAATVARVYQVSSNVALECKA